MITPDTVLTIVGAATGTVGIAVGIAVGYAVGSRKDDTPEQPAPVTAPVRQVQPIRIPPTATWTPHPKPTTGHGRHYKGEWSRKPDGMTGKRWKPGVVHTTALPAKTLKDSGVAL